jgi:CBS domain-containing protein
MKVSEAMSPMVLIIGPEHTLRDAARLMSERKVGAAVVVNVDSSGPGILTERDILNALGQGLDPDEEVAGDHLTGDLVFASAEWDVARAAAAMVRGNFRHLVVTDEVGEVVGMLSVRDVVRVGVAAQMLSPSAGAA